jgi:imidazolonepropionase
MQTVDLIIHHAQQIATCGGGVKRGDALRDVCIVTDSAIAIKDGIIVAIDKNDVIMAQFNAESTIDASGKAVCPGFVDPHTHIIFAGDRVGELELRIQGAQYLDILKQGGGILHTVRATRAASEDDLVQLATKRLDAMLAMGTTTVEIKTGYGLDAATELKMLRVIERLAQTHVMDIVPTFMPAHAIPPEYAGTPDAFIDHIIADMLPQAAEWYAQSLFKARDIPFFIDIFCEDGAFSVAHLHRIADAGDKHNMLLKAHVDEFVNLGGAKAAVEHGATSVDHLDYTGEAEIEVIAASDTAAVVLPAVNFNLGSYHYANARHMIDSGAIVALSTDANPGSAPSYSMPMMMALASRYQRLLPAETLNASTIQAAYAIDLHDRLGTLEVGKQADLLLLDALDYRHIIYTFGGNIVDTVIKRGQVINNQLA